MKEESKDYIKGWKEALEWVQLILSYKSLEKVKELIEKDLKESK